MPLSHYINIFGHYKLRDLDKAESSSIWFSYVFSKRIQYLSNYRIWNPFTKPFKKTHHQVITKSFLFNPIILNSLPTSPFNQTPKSPHHCFSQHFSFNNRALYWQDTLKILTRLFSTPAHLLITVIWQYAQRVWHTPRAYRRNLH